MRGGELAVVQDRAAVDLAGRGGMLGDIGAPQAVGSVGDELALDQVVDRRSGRWRRLWAWLIPRLPVRASSSPTRLRLTRTSSPRRSSACTRGDPWGPDGPTATRPRADVKPVAGPPQTWISSPGLLAPLPRGGRRQPHCGGGGRSGHRGHRSGVSSAARGCRPSSSTAGLAAAQPGLGRTQTPPRHRGVGQTWAKQRQMAEK